MNDREEKSAMDEREKIFGRVKDTYGIEPDYPWKKYPRHAVFRHPDSRKGFGVLMDVPAKKPGLPGEGRVDMLNLKGDSVLIGSLRTEPGVFPAWHMNREHGFSLLPESPFARANSRDLIGMSVELTRQPGTRKNKRAK